MGGFFCVNPTMGIFDIFRNWQKNELGQFSEKKGQKKKSKKSSSIDPEKAKIMRKLKHKSKYLELEYEEAKEILEIAKTEFFTSIQEYCQANPEAKNPLCPVEPNKKKDKTDMDFPDELKTIYREIIKATHPDHHQEGDEEELTETLISATHAKQENKIEDLINISFDLDIDISNISLDLIEEVEKGLRKKEIKIKKMRKNNAVVWYYAPPDQRKIFIERICPIKKEE